MPDHTLVIYSDTAVEVANEPSTDVIVISRSLCRDFDYAANQIQNLLEDGNLSGPEQMQIVIDIASNFLVAHGQPLDTAFDYLGSECLPLPETEVAK